MLAPVDKVLNGGNDILQIDICTVCPLSCSSCTRLLPWRRDYKHMSVECFREAVRASKDWPGVLALFGGEPCAHPQFPELCAILREEIPDQRRRGLWSANFLKHGAVVRETFFPAGRTNLNAHGNADTYAEMERWMPGKVIRSSRAAPSAHGPILIDRRDYGISDAEWETIREGCDINRNWSAAIVERDGRPFGYFCEIASSIDGARGENHGVPVEPGWWRKRMPEFEHQVRACCDRGCGVPLRLKGRLDREETYDLSPSWDAELRDVRRRQRVEVVVHETMPGEKSHELTDYLHLRRGRR